AAGEVYVSPIDLSRDHDIAATPHIPVLHVATPLQKPDGSPFGLVIINIDMRPAFARIRAAARDGGRIYPANAPGDYLRHPEPAIELGFELGQPSRLQDDFPDFARLLDANASTPQVMRDRTGAEFGVGWTAVRLAEGPRVAVINAIPYKALMAAAIA